MVSMVCVIPSANQVVCVSSMLKPIASTFPDAVKSSCVNSIQYSISCIVNITAALKTTGCATDIRMSFICKASESSSLLVIFPSSTVLLAFSDNANDKSEICKLMVECFLACCVSSLGSTRRNSPSFIDIS